MYEYITIFHILPDIWIIYNFGLLQLKLYDFHEKVPV